ncbi:DUF6478 family protein [Vannielia litorea]|uniref:DUF6478 family protein n=1 Tax=Vannielia litorea TaxID=1217970 RepID=UPI0021BD8209|nr:DUF6478 family protein [Vannielia litorea]
MAKPMDSLIERIAQRRALRRWSRAADAAASTDLPALREMRSRARQLRRQIDRVLHEADGRLTLPLLGSNAMRKPIGADWGWRPELWRGPISPPGHAAAETRTMLGQAATLYHDCTQSELTLRQIRNTSEDDLAPFGLRMDVFRFDGSFLSIVLDLPSEAVDGLKRKHVIGLEARLEVEKPLEIFARLNVKHGPNTEQVVRELSMSEGGVQTAEFDLAYTGLNEKRVEKAWIDLIFEGPQMNQIVLRDLTFSRRPRAEI